MDKDTLQEMLVFYQGKISKLYKISKIMRDPTIRMWQYFDDDNWETLRSLVDDKIFKYENIINDINTKL